jgi:hypothetical protein
MLSSPASYSQVLGLDLGYHVSSFPSSVCSDKLIYHDKTGHDHFLPQDFSIHLSQSGYGSIILLNLIRNMGAQNRDIMEKFKNKNNS